MSYVKTDWVEAVTPLNEINLDKIEQGIYDAHLAADAALAGLPPPIAGQEGKWLTVSGGAMVWAPAPAGGGGGGLDWEGNWVNTTPYVKGDVVTYQGVTYGAVNDSTGQTPPSTVAGVAQSAVPVPLVTVLPSTPFDGQEIILTDSLTVPTYAWRLRYTLSITDGYRWVLVGGSEAKAEVAAAENTNSPTYVNLATVGPSLVIPRAGIYDVSIGAQGTVTAGTSGLMSYEIGATAAVDADGAAWDCQNTNGVRSSCWQTRRKTLAAGITLTAKYRMVAGTSAYFSARQLLVRPVRLA